MPYIKTPCGGTVWIPDEEEVQTPEPIIEDEPETIEWPFEESEPIPVSFPISIPAEYA